MIKNFEQYNIDPYDEENWDEINIGDRVICNTRLIKNEKGTICDYLPSAHINEECLKKINE